VIAPRAFCAVLAVTGMAAVPTGAEAATARSDPEGLTVVLRPDEHERLDVVLALSALNRRVDGLRVPGASVTQRRSDVVVRLPGVTDASLADRLVVPVELRFRPVLLAGLESEHDEGPSDEASAAVVRSCDPNAVAALPSIPTTRWIDESADECVVFPDEPGGARAQRSYLGPSALGSRAVRSVRYEFVSSQGWTVRIVLTPDGSSDWDRLAQAQFHEQVAISLEGVVMAAPTIQPGESTFTSFGGTAMISGRFTQREAKELAALIGGGSRTPIFEIERVRLR
jgi:SecD/SecF fusion protein